MRNSAYLLVLLMALTVFNSCHDWSLKYNKTFIQAKFPKGIGQRVYLYELNIHSKDLIDSTVVNEHGEFFFLVKIAEPGFYLLEFGEQGSIPLVLHDKQDVVFRSESKDYLYNYSVEGSEDTELLRVFDSIHHDNMIRVDSIGKLVLQYQQHPDFARVKSATDAYFNELYLREQYALKELIKENYQSLASLLLLNQQFVRKPLLSPYQDFEYFEMIDTALIRQYPENKHTLDHHSRVSLLRQEIQKRNDAEERWHIGKVIPEIALKDTSNKVIPISTLKGKVVLLYFWVAWDAKCRREHQQLRLVSQEFSDTAFEIYGVSLDNNYRIWKSAIDLDSTTWIQVSDLEGWESPVKSLMNVPDDLPYYIVLDEDGQIILKTRELKKIREQLGELMSKSE
jgi:peroxiredoxin